MMKQEKLRLIFGKKSKSCAVEEDMGHTVDIILSSMLVLQVTARFPLFILFNIMGTLNMIRFQKKINISQFPSHLFLFTYIPSHFPPTYTKYM